MRLTASLRFELRTRFSADGLLGKATPSCLSSRVLMAKAPETVHPVRLDTRLDAARRLTGLELGDPAPKNAERRSAGRPVGTEQLPNAYGDGNGLAAPQRSGGRSRSRQLRLDAAILYNEFEDL